MSYAEGYLTAMIQADASIHSEPHKGGRRPALEWEVGDEALAERIRDLTDAASVTVRRPRPSNKLGTRPTYRVRLRGPRVEALLRRVFPALTPERKARVIVVFAECGLTTPSPT